MVFAIDLLDRSAVESGMRPARCLRNSDFAVHPRWISAFLRFPLSRTLQASDLISVCQSAVFAQNLESSKAHGGTEEAQKVGFSA